ncbi:MAG: hypothetical protein MUE99_10750 [Chitinophagaceae bacterium]|nr:hypothetical protein [Chitinophagaceae bacterium]
MVKQNSGLILILFVFIAATGLVACEKTTFNTKPTLKFVRAGSYDVSQGDFMSFELQVTDKEGDISDSIWIRAFTRRCPNSTLVIPYKIPDVPQKANLDADLNVTYLIGVIDPSAPIWNLNLCPGVDTAIFQFWMRDIGGNRSDTVEVDQPILIRNN